MVFRSVEAKLPPDRWYRAGRSVVETSFLNTDREPRIDNPADIQEYFERLYRTGDLDAEGIQNARRRFEFATVAEKYRLIDNDGVAVVVPSWEQRKDEIEALITGIRKPNRTRASFRRLTPFQVNLRRDELAQADQAVKEEAPGVLVWRGGYDPEIGLTASNVDTLLLV
jgi:hypothetical protein